MELPEGLYDLLKTPALLKELSKNKQECQAEWSKESTPEREAYLQQFQNHVATQIANFIKLHTLENPKDKTLEKSISELITNLFNSQDFTNLITQSIIPKDNQRLLSLYKSKNIFTPARPDTPLYASSLLTGSSRTPSLISQIAKELSSCDRADWLVSFIKMSGINPLREILEEFTKTPTSDGTPKLRIATTSYMGATDAEAINILRKLPNTEVRISYDTKRTRLHAKSYIFHRKTHFSSAYIGSANISKAAMDQGLEWTVKVSQHENPHLWTDTIGAFESHWADTKEFTCCKSDEDIQTLRQALKAEKNYAENKTAPTVFYDITPYNFQQEILEDIENERQANKTKHLIVAATGTGKTMIAAFDFKNYKKKHSDARLLFLVHREEILKQAQTVFRQVLKDGSFGEIVSGNYKPVTKQHWFCTIQSWYSKYQSIFSNDHFTYVVMDEAHHAQASTYKAVLKNLKPKSLLALTATPERADGKSIIDDFGGSYTHELRLAESIERGLICPFHYYGIPDYSEIDFSNIQWNKGKYNIEELEQMLTQNTKRSNWVLEQIARYVDNIHDIRAIGFCVSIKHANIMADLCNNYGIKAIALSSESNPEDRKTALERLKNKDIQIIFTVDLYNEGVDIVDIDTVIFLRPTESLTIFLQQLGRGLRRADDKSHLNVFDFIARQNKNYNFENKFAALSCSLRPVTEQISQRFPCLPTGCNIYLERQAQETILNHIKLNNNLLQTNTLIKRIYELLQPNKQRIPLTELITNLNLTNPDRIYKSNLPHLIFKAAIQKIREKKEFTIDNELKEYQDSLKKGFRRLLLQTDANLLTQSKDALLKPTISSQNITILNLFYTVLFGEKKPNNKTLQDTHDFIKSHPELKRDIIELIDWILENKALYNKKLFPASGILALHASYTRNQILLALGQGTYENKDSCREGVKHIADKKILVFFADINKSETDFSPTTMYEDYALTENLFHWQSQSTTKSESSMGQLYIHHQRENYTILLFIRKCKEAQKDISAPYVYLGPVNYIKHEGDKPMSITWQLENPIPAHVLAWARKVD